MPARLFLLAAVLCAPVSAQGFVLELRPQGSYGGSALAPAGDVDADGYPDIAVGSAGGINSTGGFVRVFSGRTTEQLYRAFEDPAAYSAGLTLTNLGDLDGDGLDELAAGDELWGDASDRPGSVTITRGGTGALLELLIGDDTLDLFGWSVDRVPDVDLDGVFDLAVGAPGADTGGRAAGAVILFSGATRARLWRVDGSELEGAFGYVVRGIADVNGDGRGDVVVSAPGATSATGAVSAGRVFVLSGTTGAIVRAIDGNAAHESFGRALAVAGDADGDGLDDIVVGSPFASRVAVSGGRVDLISSASGNALWSVGGTTVAESLGQYVGDVGDLDGDGRRDFAFVRRLGGDDFRESECTAVSVASGAILFRVPSAHFASDRRPLIGIGDLSGDGLDDLVLGRSAYDRVHVHQLGSRPLGSICDAEPNSVEATGAHLTSLSASDYAVSENDIDLRVSSLPLGPGYFLVSTSTGIVPQVGGGVGTLCIAGAPFGRYANNVLIATGGFFGGNVGSVHMLVDNGTIPLSGTPSGTIAALPGDTFYFQYWYRDTLTSGAPTSNLSNAIAVSYR